MRSKLGDVARLARTFDLSDGNCLRLEHTRDENGDYISPSLWDSRLGRETPEETAERHSQAVSLCQSCPCLETCKEYAAAVKDHSATIDGVVAGVAPKTNAIRKCSVCGVDIIHHTLHTPGMDAQPEAAKGMCSKCYRAHLRRERNKNARRASRRVVSPSGVVADVVEGVG